MDKESRFVVMGTTGEYSDRMEWPVCWTVSKDEAQSLVERLTRASKVWDATRDGSFAAPFDPFWKCSYTGPAEYFYYEAGYCSGTLFGLDKFEQEQGLE